MESVIFRYMNRGGDVVLAIGSQKFFHHKLRTARQLMEMVMLVHTDEQWHELTEKTQEELCETLEAILWENALVVEHPN